MNENDGILLVSISMLRTVVDKTQPLEARLRAAMEAAQDENFCWMLTEEDQRFRAAIGAVLAESDDDDEKDRIGIELDGIRAISAIFTGIPVDLDRVETLENPIGMLKIWKEVIKK